MDKPIIHPTPVADKGQSCPTISDHWRKPKPWDHVFNYVSRLALARLHMYPSQPMREMPDLRARLHQIVDELNPTDLWGLYHLARILLITQRPDQIFDFVIRQGEEAAARYKGAK